MQEDELDEYIEVYKKELEENEVLQQNLAEVTCKQNLVSFAV